MVCIALSFISSCALAKLMVEDMATTMASLAKLESCTSELAAAVEILAEYCQKIEAPVDIAAYDTPQPLVSPKAPSEAHRARRSIMSNIAKLQTLLGEPADFLHQLAGQVRLFLPRAPPIFNTERT